MHQTLPDLTRHAPDITILEPSAFQKYSTCWVFVFVFALVDKGYMSPKSRRTLKNVKDASRKVGGKKCRRNSPSDKNARVRPEKPDSGTRNSPNLGHGPKSRRTLKNVKDAARKVGGKKCRRNSPSEKNARVRPQKPLFLVPERSFSGLIRAASKIPEF